MLRVSAVASLCLTLAACGEATPTERAAEVAPAGADIPADDAPKTFVAAYPGGEVEGAAPWGQSSGQVRFVTRDAPETVVAYYRQRAEAAGLAATMAMNQGDVRAYGAAGGPGGGATLQVVATPEGGRTAVDLSWTGR